MLFEIPKNYLQKLVMGYIKEYKFKLINGTVTIKESEINEDCIVIKIDK